VGASGGRAVERGVRGGVDRQTIAPSQKFKADDANYDTDVVSGGRL
jgi:hypothetical protein